LLDINSAVVDIRCIHVGLFSVPAPLFNLLAGSSAGFFRFDAKTPFEAFVYSRVGD
jgi:hypothetical protein